MFTLPSTTTDLNGSGLTIGIVQSRFNPAVTDTLREACQKELQTLGVDPKNIHVSQVAGALEIGVVLQAMARLERYDALIALGCVIRGETYHFELVCHESAAAITRLALEHQLPIVNAIVTTENEIQAQARQVVKGIEAARVAIETAHILQSMR